MITEKIVIAGIIAATIVMICLIGTIGDLLKERGKRKHERKNDDSI